MSMRTHQIESAYNAFEADADDEVSQRISKPAKPEVRVIPKNIERAEGDPVMRAVGQAMIRTGVAILAVPDPIPFVDELVGVALVGGGATILYLEQ